VKLNDAVWGALLLALSAAVFFAIRNFPNIPARASARAPFRRSSPPRSPAVP
jgi:hypothetical protein